MGCSNSIPETDTPNKPKQTTPSQPQPVESTNDQPTRANIIQQQEQPVETQHQDPPQESIQSSGPPIHILHDIGGEPVPAFGLLICGAGESGKSTIVRQLRILALPSFTDTERKDYMRVIRSNLVDTMQLYNVWLEKNDKSVLPENSQYMDQIISLDVSTITSLDIETTDMLKTLWNDPNIQEAFVNSYETEVPDHMEYFFDKIDELADDDYIASDQDVIFSRIRTIGVEAVAAKVEDTTIRFFDVGGQQSERNKWGNVFNRVKGVVYVFGVGDFCKPMFEEPEIMRIDDYIEWFQKICNNKLFHDSPIFLVANKFDVFSEICKETDVFSRIFPDYAGDIHDPDACLEFVFSKFTSSIEPRESQPIMQLKLTATNADDVFEFATRIARYVNEHFPGQTS